MKEPIKTVTVRGQQLRIFRGGPIPPKQRRSARRPAEQRTPCVLIVMTQRRVYVRAERYAIMAKAKIMAAKRRAEGYRTRVISAFGKLR